MISGTEECRGSSSSAVGENQTATISSSTVEFVGAASRKDNKVTTAITNFGSVGADESQKAEPTNMNGTQRHFLCGQAAQTTSGERVLLINYVSPTATSTSPDISNLKNATATATATAGSSAATSNLSKTRKILHSRLLNPAQAASITPVSVAGLGSEVTVTITRSGKTSADHIVQNKSKPKYYFQHQENQHQISSTDEEQQKYQQLRKETPTTLLTTSALNSSPPPLVFAHSVHLHSQNEHQILPMINNPHQQQDKVTLTNLQTAESLLAPLDLQEEGQLAEDDFRQQHQQIIIEHQHPHQPLQHHFQHDEEQLLGYNNVEEVEEHHLHHLVNVHDHQECIQEQVEEVYIS